MHGAALYMVPEYPIHHRLVVAATGGIDPVAEPAEDIVVDPNGDPGLTRRGREDRAALAFAEVVVPLHGFTNREIMTGSALPCDAQCSQFRGVDRAPYRRFDPIAIDSLFDGPALKSSPPETPTRPRSSAPVPPPG